MTALNFTHHPEISIILPTYNRAEYLSDCIESVLAQDFQDWELLIIDDGSQDQTFEIVNPLLQQDPRIRYFKHQNRQQGFSRNAGIQAAFGKYITFIDSDDLYLPNHLSARIAYIQQHPELDLIEGGFEVKGDVWVADFYQAGAKISIYDCIVGATFFGRKQVFLELQGFSNLPYGEDTDFWARAEQQFKVAKLTEPPSYIYIRTEDSVTGKAIANLA